MPKVTDPSLLQQLNGGGGVIRPNDPYKPAAERRAEQASDLSRASTLNQIGNSNADNARADAAAALARSNAAADLYSKGLRIGSNGQPEPIPGWQPIATKPILSATERADAIQGYKSANAIDKLVAQMEQQYKAGPGATKGLAGLQDYFPTTANKQFDNTGNAARGHVGTALGFTGGQLNTATESAQSVGPYLPQAGDRDEVILDKIQRLKDLASTARDRTTAILGGVPDANGAVHPVDPNKGMIPGAQSNGGPTTPDWSWSGSPTAVGPGGGAAPVGSTTKQADIPPQMQAALNAYLSTVPRGQLDAKQFGSFMDSLYEGSGMKQVSRPDYAPFIKGYNTKGVGVDAKIRGEEVPMSGVDQFRNNIVNNPIGAGVANFADNMGFGIPSMLAPEQIGALKEAQPVGSAIGQIAGAIGATKGIGAIGSNTVGRLAPKTLGGGARGMFGRGLATDATFGGIYGGTTEGDPLTGALAGTVGSAAGQTIGKGLAKGLTGGGSAAAAALRSRGIPLTVGQAVNSNGLIGRTIKGVEDRLAGFPIVGDMVNARRLEGLKAFNESALGDVTGNQVTQTGPEAIDQLRPAVSGMYDRATAGVNVPVGQQLTSDIASAKTLGGTLPPDLAERFGLAMKNRIDPVIDSGQMTGEQFQQMQRALKGYRAESPKAGFEQDYRDNLGMVTNALDANMRAQGGGSVIAGLDEANGAYRNLKVVEDAVSRARNGTRSGEAGIFTPSQLNDASTASARKFGGTQATTERPFYKLANAGQEVLPSSIPDSGTAGRLSTLALPGILGGGGLGLDQLGVTDDGATTGLALGALLTAGGTKHAQSALVKAILDRPDLVRRLGAQVGKRQGMFGSALAPLAIEQLAP